MDEDTDADHIREAQGWNDSTMLDLAHQFIFGTIHRGEAYGEFLRDIAKTENEGP